ncbi:uncharacterized protein LOC103317194 isoform X2 [Nasonia vitripennis]|nr:uncharacterized protein LOC103317194 isoform X2 [Nasonia vitripennis]
MYVEHTHDHMPKQWTNDELSSIKKQNNAGSVANDEVLKKTEEMVRMDVHIQEKESADDVVKKNVNEQMVRKEQHTQKPESSLMQYNVETVTQDSLPFEQPNLQDHNFVNDSTLDENITMYTKKANVKVHESTIDEEQENIESAHQGNNDFEEPESPTMEQYNVESSLIESSTLGHCEKFKNDQELDKIISTLRQHLYLIRDQESKIFLNAKTTIKNLNNNLEEQKYTMLEWMKLLPGQIENVLDGVYRLKTSDLNDIDSFIQHFLDKEVNVDLLKEHFEDKAFKKLKKVINTKVKSNAYTCGKFSEDIGELRTVLMRCMHAVVPLSLRKSI